MTEEKMGAGILSIGMAVPDQVLSNYDFEGMIDTSDEWITTRTGIKERRIANEMVATSDLAAEAGRHALKKAGMSSQDIDLIILATATPDYPFPAAACNVQELLDADNAAAFDISAACSGFLYGMTMARGLINNGDFKHVLLIGAETLTKICDFTDRATCVLFGDGAGAVVLGKVPEDKGILSTYMKSDGRLVHILNMPAGGSRKPATHETVEKRQHYIKMQGNELFKYATRAMAESAKSVLDEAGFEPSDVDLFIPHQANIRIIEATAKRVGIPKEKVYVNIQRYGNTSAASIPIALLEAQNKGIIKDGSIVLLTAAGGGVTWAGALLRW
jgi:3-oxoacyl-[acyl-carrier-protein] synthase-3